MLFSSHIRLEGSTPYQEAIVNLLSALEKMKLEGTFDNGVETLERSNKVVIACRLGCWLSNVLDSPCMQ